MLDGSQHRVERDDRLAAAHLAQQQPLHRARLREVLADLGDCPPLLSGRLERQLARQPPLAERPLLGERPRAGAGTAPGATAQEHELLQQQLLEGEPLATRARVLGTTREVHRGERAGPVGQPLAHAGGGRERLGHIGEGGARAAHERQDLRR